MAENASPGPTSSRIAAPLTSIQPGGGSCMALELAWGRWRKWLLRTFRPKYVRMMAERRQGVCSNCPHDIVDPRDLKFYRNVCGYWFKPEDDRFRWRDRLGVARVGLGEIVISSLIDLLLLALCWLVASCGWPYGAVLPLVGAMTLVWLQTIYFFRDPERIIPNDPSALVSPADGTITDIVEVEDADCPGGRALRIGIFLSVFNVHVNRIPRSGTVTRLQYFPGQFFDARRAEARTDNEQLWIDFRDAGTQLPIRVKQISGLIARRIVCWLKVGDELRAGDRIGMIKFGSRTEVYLPTEQPVEVAVRVGESVQGGATVLLRFKEK
jgi:phosphatidylserine decarboxylase